MIYEVLKWKYYARNGCNRNSEERISHFYDVFPEQEFLPYFCRPSYSPILTHAHLHIRTIYASIQALDFPSVRVSAVISHRMLCYRTQIDEDLYRVSLKEFSDSVRF